MKGNGNGFKTLFEKLFFMLLPTAGMRSKYVQSQRNRFRQLGTKIQWQPRKFPSDPELISIGSNVRLASGVSLINHDRVDAIINDGGLCDLQIKPLSQCIRIGNNVLIGANSLIMPNTEIGNNVVIAAGSVVSRDIPDNTVAGGIPAKPICSFESLVEKRKKTKLSAQDGADALWHEFDEMRMVKE